MLGGKRGDAAGQVMHGAFVYGFRRLVAIRRLAGRDEGTEALILARSLLSIVARAAYVDESDEPDERRRRYEQYYVKDLNERLKMVTDLIDTGFDVQDTRQELRADLEPLEQAAVKPLSSDDTLLRKLNLRPFYAASTGRDLSTSTSRLPRQSARCRRPRREHRPGRPGARRRGDAPRDHGLRNAARTL